MSSINNPNEAAERPSEAAEKLKAKFLNFPHARIIAEFSEPIS